MNETTKINLYETDFLEWIQKTAILLREKNYEQVDFENLIEEIEAMGRSEKSQARNRLITLIEHLLKIIYWESEQYYSLKGWKQTIVTQRSKLRILLENSPSLRRYLEENWLECYKDAADNFEFVSGEKIPETPSFSLENVLDKRFIGLKNTEN